MRQQHGMGTSTVGADGRIYAFGGTYNLTKSRYAEAYGPAIRLAKRAGPAGATDVLSGTNFAAGAAVSVYWGTAYTGTVLAAGRSDAKGNLVAPITFTVPLTVTPGTYWVTAMDASSRYPVRWPYAVKSSVPDVSGAMAAAEVRKG
jgi:hypothetical protein